MNTAAAPAWRLDFDGAELSAARPVDGGWQLRFAVVPAQPLHHPGPGAAAPGHALGVVLWLLDATLASTNASTTAAAGPIGRCRSLQWWPADAAALAGPAPAQQALHLPSGPLGPGRLQLELTQGDRLCWHTQGLQLLQPDGPRWVEHLHC